MKFIINMLDQIAAAQLSKKRRRMTANYNAGFDWAVGALLRNELTEDDIDAKTFQTDTVTSFDSGAQSGLEEVLKLRRHKNKACTKKQPGD